MAVDVAVTAISGNPNNYSHITIALPGAKTFSSRAVDDDTNNGATPDQLFTNLGERLDDTTYYTA